MRSGPILEVIVSRMRYIAAHTARDVRFVGLSTAVANAQDLADWLGIGSKVWDFKGLHSIADCEPVLNALNIGALCQKVLAYCASGSIHCLVCTVTPCRACSTSSPACGRCLWRRTYRCS